jgi:hypothetical protein
VKEKGTVWFLYSRGLALLCLWIAPATFDGVGKPLAAFLVRTGLAHAIALAAFVACLYLLNRVILELYQEYINRE